MIKKLKEKIKSIKYLDEKKRLIVFGLFLLATLFLAYGLFSRSFASYQSNLKLNANIDQALYVFGGERLSFNIDSSKIIPSATPYEYKFSVSNFDANKHSDINIDYTLNVRTTTNLPIQLSLYRNGSTTNLLSNVQFLQDDDGSWYNVYETNDVYRINYRDKVTDVYVFKVFFPPEYSDNLAYVDAIENIEIILKSSQVV